MRYLPRLYVLFIIFFHGYAQAALNLVLTQGVNSAQPIAIVPFLGQSNTSAMDNISAVITNDLQNSGRFKALSQGNMPAEPHEANAVDSNVWRETGVESVVVGRAEPLGGGNYKITFALVDIFKSQNHPVLATQTFTVQKNQLRRLAHHISDIVYEKLTGERGIFSTKIAYVLAQRNGKQARYILEVADADGYNPRPVLTSYEPIMSPAWSHDGTRLAFVSFENKRAQIYIANVATGERRLVSSFPGINNAPAWSPDNRKLALVLSQEGTGPKIHVMDLASLQLKQVTQGSAIDTEPNWSPDGRSLIFTSGRGGSPQIYRVNLGNGQTERLTFKGEYNARASFTPDGKHIVMLHRENGMYNIAIQDLENGAIDILTSSGRDESPSVAPNGSMVIHGTEYGVLGLVSTDGRVKLQLPAREGKVQDPAWSPFSS